MLMDALIAHALEKAKHQSIRELRAGLGYTCAVLEDGSSGLAYTFRNELGHGCGVLPEAGKLGGKDCETLIPWAKDPNRLKAAMGLATLNAVLSSGPSAWKTGNVIEAIDVNPNETFGMIGEFSPILHHVRKRTDKIYVFELNAKEGSGLYPDSAIGDLLPSCDVVVITATSIINHTIDHILPYCQNARLVCITGPSTPICPEVFRPYNVTLLAGSVVTDPDGALAIISQGGGTMQMRPVLRHVLVKP